MSYLSDVDVAFEAARGYLHDLGALLSRRVGINWCIQQVEEGRKQ